MEENLKRELELASCAGGIIFTGESVRAIRDGRKTQTRRLCKQAVSKYGGEVAKSIHPDGSGTGWIAWFGAFEVSAEHTARLYPGGYPGADGFRPRYQVGKRYYVRETWAHIRDINDQLNYEYRADTGDKYPGEWPDDMGDDAECPRWASSMRMPRDAARYVVEITDVRVERLQDITVEDAKAEGSEPAIIPEAWACMDKEGCAFDALGEPGNEMRRNLVACVHVPAKVLHDARESYRLAWNRINGKRADWDSNPWVWVYVFRLVGETRP